MRGEIEGKKVCICVRRKGRKGLHICEEKRKKRFAYMKRDIEVRKGLYI